MDAATIHETNRIRLSLGMKPLPVPGAQQAESSHSSDSDGEQASTLETRQAKAYDNYNKHIETEKLKKRRDEKSSAARKAREKAQRFALIQGKGLADTQDGQDDAKSWLMGLKKRQKKVAEARKLEEELAAAEAAAAQNIQYTSKDLAGLKVAHDTSAFLEGGEQILTLKDATIDENEEQGDELENINLREEEKLQNRLDLKKMRPGYNPNDDNQDEQRGILSQYDEEINGKKTTRFTLDSDGAIAEMSDVMGQSAPKTNKLQNINLDDIVGNMPISSDYLTPSEIKVKKPKKKKKNTRRKQVDDDEDSLFPVQPVNKATADAMDIDSKDDMASRKRKAEADDLDDDDLQASLMIQRRNALKKRRKIKPQDIAKQLKEQVDEPDHDTGAEDGGLIIGDTSEFVAGLSKHIDQDEEIAAKKRTMEREAATRGSPDDEDAWMEDADGYEVGGAHKPEPPEPGANVPEDGFDDEKAVGQGMGAALSLLRERGLIEESQGNDRHSNFRQQQEFLLRKKELEEELEAKARQQRERDRANGKLDRMSRADREDYARQQNAWRDQQLSRRMADLISAHYRPSVALRYTDEHGRHLGQKEAFKHLSHQFHGKGSGKGKTEKKLKQIEDEKRREAQSLFDASQGGGMNAATTQQLKKRKEAGVRLG
ncbi:hypothetical protein CDD81_3270 [Ophiocordyceps australis]|uniref:SART-1 protein n=1 Tax=Ophiocordyceps australis TaxID=1399860 RepID=A0A2C5XAS7_9HYPO|nr:hypothetical protein CDD81_3270 [Ophiocordyceps australis]